MPAETDSQQPSAATDLGGREKTCVSREEGLLAPILESSDDAIMGQTLEGTILVWNAAAEKLYGYSAQRLWVNALAPSLFRPNVKRR